MHYFCKLYRYKPLDLREDEFARDLNFRILHATIISRYHKTQILPHYLNE